MANVENTEENLAKCHCPKCPTMNDCGRLLGEPRLGAGREKGEKLFCGRGKGSCDYKTNGCICGGCPVHRDNHLDNHYYCRGGAAAQIG
jgi:hypothetical protein